MLAARWTNSELIKLRQAAEAATVTDSTFLSELELELPNRTRHAIVSKLQKEGLYKKVGTASKLWTAEEIDILKTVEKSTKVTKDILDSLQPLLPNRTSGAIWSKMKTLGFTWKKEEERGVLELSPKAIESLFPLYMLGTSITDLAQMFGLEEAQLKEALTPQAKKLKRDLNNIDIASPSREAYLVMELYRTTNITPDIIKVILPNG